MSNILNINKEIQFDLSSLTSDINNIIQSRLNLILKDFIEKYNLYEETYKGVMGLPPVVDLMRTFSTQQDLKKETIQFDERCDADFVKVPKFQYDHYFELVNKNVLLSESNKFQKQEIEQLNKLVEHYKKNQIVNITVKNEVLEKENIVHVSLLKK